MENVIFFNPSLKKIIFFMYLSEHSLYQTNPRSVFSGLLVRVSVSKSWRRLEDC